MLNFIEKNILSAKLIGRGGSWLDAGSIDDLNNASNYVATIEDRQGLKVGCIEEIAYKKKWITKKHLKALIKDYGNCEYSTYLKKLLDE